MMRDPGLDDDYCDGLSEPPAPTCDWCGDPVPADRPDSYYCSDSCSLAAEQDSEEDAAWEA